MRIPERTLSDLAPACDAILSDVWGVVHNGVAATASACEALARFRAQGKPVILVSNAPRPASAVRVLLDRLGVPREAYDDILTSGDMTRALLEADPWAWVHHVGPERDLPLFQGLDLTFADPDEADLAVVTGLVDDETETAEDYADLLATYLEHDVPMICANPDVIVERGERLIPCAGAIATLYEKQGGSVRYMGKPHEPVFETALDRLATRLGRAPERERVLMIGDAIATDMTGAKRMGLSALFVAGGIHGKELGLGDAADGAAVEQLLASARLAPVGWCRRLGW